MVKGCDLRTAGSFNIWNYANLLTSLALINYYLTLAMSSEKYIINRLPDKRTDGPGLVLDDLHELGEQVEDGVGGLLRQPLHRLPPHPGVREYGQQQLQDI